MKHSHNWPVIIIVVLCGFLCVAVFSALEQSRKLAEMNEVLIRLPNSQCEWHDAHDGMCPGVHGEVVLRLRHGKHERPAAYYRYDSIGGWIFLCKFEPSK